MIESNPTLQEIHVLGLVRGAIAQKHTITIVVSQAKDILYWIKFLASHGAASSAGPYVAPWGHERLVNHSKEILARWELCYRITHNELQVLITTLPGLLQKTPHISHIHHNLLVLKVGAEIELDVLAQSFEGLGYRHTLQCHEKGTWVCQGGVLECFPINTNFPVRIEFFGDEILSLKFFDIESHVSFDSIEQLTIAPGIGLHGNKATQTQRLYEHILDLPVSTQARSQLMDIFSTQEASFVHKHAVLTAILYEHTQTLFELLTSNNQFVFIDGVERTKCAFEKQLQKFYELYQQDLSQDIPSLSPGKYFEDFDQKKAVFTDVQIIFEDPYQSTFHSTPQNTWPDLEDCKKPVYVFVTSRHEQEYLYERLNTPLEARREYEQLEYFYPHMKYQTSGFCIFKGEFIHKAWDEISQAFFINAWELLGKKVKHTHPPKDLRRTILNVRDLQLNDYVVHEDYGIGQYTGLVSKDLGGTHCEFVSITYQGGDKIFVPILKLAKLTKYQTHLAQINLDKLGNGQWEKRRAKVQRAVFHAADLLLKSQAFRQNNVILPYDPPDELYTSWAQGCPFEETADQLKAIQDIEEDFLKSTPMDRLLVGDVGFGKTEVAMRAAVRTILQGRQVLLLAPTTVLASQHFQTIKRRCSDLPVDIRVLFRNLSYNEEQNVLQGLHKGTIDLVIGTHRLLSKDIKLCKPGLIIIDEEHRFGVVQKETLKLLAPGAHILSLSATPIPRTLNMAMVGLREVSFLTIPPPHRSPVRTVVMPMDESVIIQAMDFEVKRGGQVFYVHNRMHRLAALAQELSVKLPHITFKYASGQMSEDTTSELMFDFIARKFDVLVCTTIIESGIDIPNVNTLIVDKSESFGLAQLHQLRGRVGRSDTQGYAYFFTKSGPLNHDAKARLQALETYQDLGAGFFLAEQDMSIRGVGNVIGAEQSGHILSVGLEHYSHMLEEAVLCLKAGITTNEELLSAARKRSIEIKLIEPVFIPEKYIAQDIQRLTFYRQIACTRSTSELLHIQDQMIDRFGPMPKPCKMLIFTALLQSTLADLNLTKIHQMGPMTLQVATKNKNFSVNIAYPKHMHMMDYLDLLKQTIVDRINGNEYN